MERHEDIVVVPGPTGVPMGYFLETAARRLPHPEFNLRYDWNTLLPRRATISTRNADTSAPACSSRRARSGPIFPRSWTLDRERFNNKRVLIVGSATPPS